MTLASAFGAAAIAARSAAPSVDISENPDRFCHEGGEQPRNGRAAKESAKRRGIVAYGDVGAAPDIPGRLEESILAENHSQPRRTFSQE